MQSRHAAWMFAALCTAAIYTPAQTLEMKSEISDAVYKFYTPGKETAVKDAKPVRLNHSSKIKGVAAVTYTLQASLYQDSRVEKHKESGTYYSSQGERGETRTIPRVTIVAKNDGVKGYTKLVIEYFASDVNDKSSRRKELVEHIPLPPMDKGQTLTVDGRGLSLYRAEYKTQGAWGGDSKSEQGREFYGMIISLFAPDGKLMYQDCFPQALDKECLETLPEATPPKLFGGGHGGGMNNQGGMPHAPDEQH